MQIRGIIPPVATPMQANEDLDLPRLRWFLDRLISAGVHGVFVLGTNSEFYALDEREKQEVLATTVAHVNKRVPVYAGTGAESTREAVRLTKMAEREGGRLYARAVIFVEQPSQKAILIGEGGTMLKRIGQAARRELEAFFGAPVYLKLWVQVRRHWRRDDAALRELGYRLTS